MEDGGYIASSNDSRIVCRAISVSVVAFRLKWEFDVAMPINIHTGMSFIVVSDIPRIAHEGNINLSRLPNRVRFIWAKVFFAIIETEPIVQAIVLLVKPPAILFIIEINYITQKSVAISIKRILIKFTIRVCTESQCSSGACIKTRCKVITRFSKYIVTARGLILDKCIDSFVIYRHSTSSILWQAIHDYIQGALASILSGYTASF